MTSSLTMFSSVLATRRKKRGKHDRAGKRMRRVAAAAECKVPDGGQGVARADTSHRAAGFWAFDRGEETLKEGGGHICYSICCCLSLSLLIIRLSNAELNANDNSNANASVWSHLFLR